MLKFGVAFIGCIGIFLTHPAGAEVIRGTGDSMNFDMGYGIMINENSTLNREWVIVTDPPIPVKLKGFTSQTLYSDRNWTYNIDYEVEVNEDVRAIEVRFIPFDVWGESDRPLSATDIKDLSAGIHNFSAEWRILSDNTAVEHYAMLGYVAQVKLASGAIVRADPEAVVKEARAFSDDFTSGDLSKNK